VRLAEWSASARNARSGLNSGNSRRAFSRSVTASSTRPTLRSELPSCRP
jgi:hypothetical protein